MPILGGLTGVDSDSIIKIQIGKFHFGGSHSYIVNGRTLKPENFLLLPIPPAKKMFDVLNIFSKS